MSADKNPDTLQRLLDTDEGARRLGEVALVPHSSPISQSGLLYYNTLFDENAASHVALGNAYKFTLKGGNEMSDEEFEQAGGNRSAVHVDFMIGSGELDVDGVLAERHDGTADAQRRVGDVVARGLLYDLPEDTEMDKHPGKDQDQNTSRNPTSIAKMPSAVHSMNRAVTTIHSTRAPAKIPDCCRSPKIRSSGVKSVTRCERLLALGFRLWALAGPRAKAQPSLSPTT